MYSFMESVKQSYELLQDDLSKKIFWARLKYDLEPSQENLAEIVALGEQQKWMNILIENIPSIVHTAEESHKKVILYGTNVTGKAVGALFLEKQINFYGFCGRRAERFANGLMGKPVISPNYLFQHSSDFYVILSARESSDEILELLKENHFPMDLVYPFFPTNSTDNQYFEFPDLFPFGTAFIDGGSLNCQTAYRFADWCSGRYSKIFAFEPDPTSYAVCEKNLADRKLRDCCLIHAGLSDHNGEVIFQTGLYGSSHIVADKNAEEGDLTVVPVATIDDTVGGETVGFIKMDIEGSELTALHGAEKVIIRDKPLLALSVYHRMGDMPIIMDYLHQLVPEYRFWIRHYSIGFAETVLYASINQVIR